LLRKNKQFILENKDAKFSITLVKEDFKFLMILMSHMCITSLCLTQEAGLCFIEILNYFESMNLSSEEIFQKIKSLTCNDFYALVKQSCILFQFENLAYSVFVKLWKFESFLLILFKMKIYE